MLGRAASVGDYVQRGSDVASINIVLRGQERGERVEILRTITTANKSEWAIDGRACRKEDVKQKMQEFNIQVGNLTQFLPQDRVCEFAKLSSTELLEETEKAVGDPELYAQHCFLIEKREGLSKLETTVKQHEGSLQHDKMENASLEKDVERMQRRNELLVKAKEMALKEPWLKYDKTKGEYLEAKAKAKEAKEQSDCAHKKIQAAQAPFREASTLLKAATTQCENAMSAQRVQNQLRDKLVSEEDELANQVQMIEAQIESIQKQAGAQQAKLARATEAYNKALEESRKFAMPDTPDKQMEPLEEEIFKLKDAIHEMDTQHKRLQHLATQKDRELDVCRKRLDEAESYKGRVTQALVTNDTRLKDSLDWLSANKHRLKGQVFGPIATEVKVADRQHAAYLEQHVPMSTWKAFITTCAEDRDLLMHNIEANVINYKAQQRSPSRIPEEARAIGVTHTLDQVFEANDIVKSTLCLMSSLDRSYIGETGVEENSEALIRWNILDLWTPGSHFRWSLSNYHNHSACISHSVRPCRIFSVGIGAEEIAQFQRTGAVLDQELRELQEKMYTLERNRKEKEQQSRQLDEEMNAIGKKYMAAKKYKKDLDTQVENLRNLVDNLQNESDPKLAVERLLASIGTVNFHRVEKALKIQRLLLQIGKKEMEASHFDLVRMEFQNKVSSLEGIFHHEEQQCKQLESVSQQLSARYLSLRGELERVKANAEKVVDLTNRPDIQEMFRTIPDNLEDLLAQIREMRDDANAMLCPNPQVVQEYERRQTQINELEKKLDVEKAEMVKLKAEINSVKTKWLGRLRVLVSTIDETFSKSFAQMAVAGEVSLDEHDEDFIKYGILIKVKFREAGELQVLSGQHQSGGERSVSTILYLVALQAITHCPFRVVDEINQGMDPNNERRMFQQLVRAASLPNTPQCFLLTPKLLSDLDYGTSCSILSIHNGPYTKIAKDDFFKPRATFMSAVRGN